MKKSKQILFALSSFALVFSTVANVVINVNAVESKNENAVSSVKDAISKLIESKNYTIEVSTKIGPLDMVYDVYYTENGFYDSFLGDEYGYVSVDEGVFSFDLYNRKFTASKLLKDEEGNNIKSIWGTDLIPSFADFRINQFKDATGKEYVTSKKIDQIAVLSILKLDITNYNTSNTIKFSVGEDMNSFKFEYSLQNGKHYECSIKDFGTTKIDVVDEYLKNSSYHQNSNTLDHIIDLFADFNYTRIMYSDDENLSTPVIGYEYFHEDYFCGEVSDEAVLAGLVVPGLSVLSIQEEFSESETINGTTFGPYTFSGCYYASIDFENGKIENMVVSFPINEDPYVPNVFNYPTFLKMFEDSQYLKPTGQENQYYTSKVDIVNDFVANFQQTDTLNNLGALPVGVYVNYLPQGDETKYPGTNNKETVVFGLEISYYGQLQVLDFVMTDFGTTSVEGVNKQAIREFIQNVIDTAKDKAREEENANNSTEETN